MTIICYNIYKTIFNNEQFESTVVNCADRNGVSACLLFQAKLKYELIQIGCGCHTEIVYQQCVLLVLLHPYLGCFSCKLSKVCQGYGRLITLSVLVLNVQLFDISLKIVMFSCIVNVFIVWWQDFYLTDHEEGASSFMFNVKSLTTSINRKLNYPMMYRVI